MNNQPLPRPNPALADLFLPERSGEIAFWTELARSYGRVVVNWHCGSGEVALSLAKSGLRVVGVDTDPALIEVARARDIEAQNDLMLSWLVHEPRLMNLPGPAHFILVGGEALGDYLIDDQRIGLLTNAYYHLRPGGGLGMSIPLAPASGVMHNTYLSGPLRRLPSGYFARRVSNLSYNAARQIVTRTDDVLVRQPDGEQRFQETSQRRLYKPGEIADILRAIGFTGIGMWGGWDRRSLRNATDFFIVRAERPVGRSTGIDADRQPDKQKAENKV